MGRPNILLITTDQQRFDTINALGNVSIYTPHLNWLVDEGIAYRNCYADCPICMPSRATIMTGMHGYSMGLTGNDSSIRPMDDYETLPAILTKNGYQTRAQGKMHFEPLRKNYGFEHMELPLEYYRARNENALLGLPKAHGVGENEVEPVISTVKEQDSLTYFTVKRSIDFLETRDDSRPFFMWTSFTKPHPPFDPCFNYWALYQNMEMPKPLSGDWDVPAGFMQPTYCLNAVHRMSPQQLLSMRRAYYACITQIDYSLGLLFARMREMDLLKDTWIIFTSDHGDMQGDHGMGAKSVFFEGSAHVPLIIRPPVRENGGTVRDTYVDLADIMPTILSIAGVQAPGNCEGRDLLSIHENRVLYGNTTNDYFMVIDGGMKYTYSAIGGAGLLFDLREDPQELHNIQDADLVKRMHAMLTSKFPAALQVKPVLAYREIGKWPGLHSTVYPTDVLH